jgi:type IV secretion system protein VirD4
LGRLEVIEKAAGLMAGYGVKLWPILQDLGQLKRHYRESWETFMGNAGILQFFANSDMTTLDWLSKRMGQIELIRRTRSVADGSSTQVSKSQSQTESSGWSRSDGQSIGHSEMPDLSQMAARDGGSSLMTLLGRTNASGVGQNVSASHQDGQSGGASRQQGDSSSSGASKTETVSEAIHRTPLMNPDEIARLFDRSTGRQIVFIDNAPVALMRTNYDEENFEPIKSSKFAE